jgi:DNA-binding transcriptional ArsR family regulator
MTSGLRDLTDLDRVIHEPARLMIVSLLYVSKDADFIFLQRETGLTKGNLSSHLARLEAAGYVRIEKMFRGKPPPQFLACVPMKAQREQRFLAVLLQLGGDEQPVSIDHR